jgi:hypothetical protein
MYVHMGIEIYMNLFLLCHINFTLTSVPDDDPRKGSKHVGLVYRDSFIHSFIHLL